MVSFKSPSFSPIKTLTRLLSSNLRCNKIVLTTCLLFQVIVVLITPTLGQLQQGVNSDTATQILAQHQNHHHNHQIIPSHHHLSNQQSQQQHHHLLNYQQIDQENNPQGNLLEQQLIALANAAKLTNGVSSNYNHYHHNQGHSTQINPISSPSSASQHSSNQSQVSSSGSGWSESSAASAGSSSSRSRSPRSIGEMFKKFFNGNKRSKQSQQSNRDWEQQQQLQQQQQQQQLQHQSQQSQAANMAAMAAAAANQHAVYASPFATYSPAVAAQSQAALYPQFSPYSSPSLVAWPTSPNLAQALRATPTLIGHPSSGVTMAGSTPLYAAASQSYNSYAVPPPSTQSAPSGPPQSSVGNPVAAASHAHPSAVPAPSGMSSGSGNSLDFHQVLDAFVRTSGFAPAGDGAEAAAASGYGSKSDGTPVFSFKKLISMPFYLSTEEKPLDGLANAVGHGGSGGYSLHSIPIMRRHVRRMSTPASQQQHQQQYNNNLAAIFGDNQQLTNNQLQRSEQAQVQQYNNYINAINNQLASMTANNQIMQYLNQQQSTPSIASQMDAYSAEAALANYQALSNLNAATSSQQQQQASASPHKSSGMNNRNSVVSNAQPANGNLALAASMMSPSAVQPPQGLGQQQQQQQQAELQAVLNSMQQMSAIDPSTSGSQFQSLNDGHRFGAQQQHQLSNNRHFHGGDLIPTYGNTGVSYNSGANLQQAAVSAGPDYLNLPQQQQQQQQAISVFSAQNNVLDHQELNHLAQQQLQQQHHHHNQISANGALMGNSNQQQSLGGNQQTSQQVENSQITANVRQQSNLNTQQSQPLQLASSLIGAGSGQQQHQDPSSTSGLSLANNNNNNNNNSNTSGNNNSSNTNNSGSNSNPNNGDASSNLDPVSQLDDQQNK